VASRLHEKYPPASTLLIEAGPDVSKHPLIVNVTPLQLSLQHPELDWDYQTIPQKYLGNKLCFGAAGKALGGGSAINACTFCMTNPTHLMDINCHRWLGAGRQK
jgi:choline dehydrogenase-like flavoprotein